MEQSLLADEAGALPAPRLLGWIAALSLLFFGGCFVFLAIEHIRYPGFTESMEGDILQHIERVTHGQPCYPRPGEEFIALTYMPLYYFVAAPFYILLGDSLAGPRLLSTLSALTAAMLVYWIAWRETRSRTIAALAAALFFASYRVMDAYLTCGLPDSLMLVWLLLGYCYFAYGTCRRHDLLWLLFFSLAFWTKQHGAFFFGFAVLYALFFRRNFLPRWALVAGLLVGGPAAYLLGGAWLGEAFYFHTFVVPHRWEHSTWFSVRRTIFVLGCFVPFSCLLSGLYMFRSLRDRAGRPSPLVWFVVTTLVSTGITMTAAGSSNNHYIPFLAFLAVTAALGFQSLLTRGVPRSWTGWALFTAVCTAGVTLFSARSSPDHPIPLFVPVAAVLTAAAVAGVSLMRRSATFRPLAATLLVTVGQWAVAAYNPLDYVQPRGYEAGLTQLRGTLAQLDEPVVWITYGNTPRALTEFKLARAPSWVALEDIERQQQVSPGDEADWQRLREGLGQRDFYLLSNDRIENVPVWKSLANQMVLVRDYGQTFADVRQVTFHWYGGGGYPRFLYRSNPVRERSAGHAHAAN